MPPILPLLLPLLAINGPAEPPSHQPDWWMGEDAPLFARAIELADLPEDGFRFHPQVVDLWGGDRWRLPLFNLFFTDPWTVSPYAREHASNARRSAANLHDLLYLAQSNTGIRVRDNYYGSFLTETVELVDGEGDRALALALSRLGADNPDAIASTDAYRAVPAEVASGAAIVLNAIADAEGYRRIALLDALERANISLEWARMRAFEECFWRAADDDDANLAGDSKFDEVRRTLDTERMLDAIDWHLLARGANLIGLATDEAIRRMQEAVPFEDDNIDFTATTRLGTVRITGRESHTHGRDDGHPLLVIDLGGDDHWHAAGASGDPRTEPIGVAIDLSGDDHYETPSTAGWLNRLENGPQGGEPGFRQEVPADHAPAFGAGLAGYGILVDVEGDDTYLAPIAGMGSGLLGHGVLQDRSGNDRYRGDVGGIGSGTFGTGALADLGGDDEYRLLHKGMGYGGTRGSGVLVDLGGDDRYLAEVDRVKYSWFDNFGTQLNMTQGFGYGRRADMDDGHSWAGGVGMLVDGGGGDDEYVCGIYGIGCAYWYALGMMHDDGGNDRYTSDSYSIASPPHFAVGVVIDESGNDVWRGRSSRACGFGRDFSLGWFEEVEGDDIYLCSDSAFGIGNVNGLAVCWDKAGNDTWCARSNSFGQPYMESEGTRRDFPISAGLFIDARGRDRYLRIPEGVSTWELDAENLPDMSNWEFMFDGSEHTWRDHIPKPDGTRPQPGATGAAIDGE